jgi:hypothetical protein
MPRGRGQRQYELVFSTANEQFCLIVVAHSAKQARRKLWVCLTRAIQGKSSIQCVGWRRTEVSLQDISTWKDIQDSDQNPHATWEDLVNQAPLTRVGAYREVVLELC